MIGCVCNWPGCEAPATRYSWACVEHWGLLPDKIRGELGHAAPCSGEEPSAYFKRAGDKALAWIRRLQAKGGKAKGSGQEGLV